MGCFDELEALDSYQEGGYCPLYLEDLIPSENPDYRILFKLGYGSASTVWFAEVLPKKQTMLEREFVSLKVTKSSLSPRPGQGEDLVILKALKATSHAGQANILHLLDYFQIHSRNGLHNVYVTDVIAPISILLDALGSIDLEAFKGWTRQLLQAIDCLHSNDAVHGDVHLGNLGVELPFLARDVVNKLSTDSSQEDRVSIDSDYEDTLSVDSRQEDKLSVNSGHENTLPIDSRQEGLIPVPTPVLKQQKPPPVHLLSSGVWEYHIYKLFKSSAGGRAAWKLVLLDFGNSFRTNIEPRPTVPFLPPACVRAPEINVGEAWGKEANIWSLGCTLYKIWYGFHIFPDNRGNGQRIFDQIEYAGAPPSRWKDHKSLAHERYAQPLPTIIPIRETYFSSAEMAKVGKSYTAMDDHGYFLSLLQNMLVLDPCDRPLAATLLAHLWFT
ncbi:hypothetical protein MMC30_008078 [Trapelia coarctata]|nr:hypothetical protein [Trapelia coarctata]